MRSALVVGLLLFLMMCPIVSSEENNDAQSENDDNTTDWIGPEFIFTCEDETSSQAQQWNSGRYYDLNEVRPDLPSGEIVKPMECYLYNPNDFNITVELSVPSGIDIWSPDEFCDEWERYGYDMQTGMYGYTETYCYNGQWIIESSNYWNQNQSFVLTKNESLYPNFTIYADSLVDPMQPGWQEINLTTRIIKTQWPGDTETLCLNCSTINYTSTQFFNQWWNIDAYINLGRCAGNYNSEYPVSFVSIYRIGSVCDDVEMSNKVEQIRNDYFMEVYCTSERKYTDIDWRSGSQYIKNCEFEIDTNWQKLFNSNKLEQAKMLDFYDDEFDYWDFEWSGPYQYENYVDEKRFTDEDFDYWGNNVCPEEIPVMVSLIMDGNSNFTKNGEIQLISHMYNLDNGSTIQEISNQTFEISSYNTTYLSNEFSLSPSEEGNLLIVLESRFILENESYVSNVLGSCLTRSSADSLNEIFEKSEITRGSAGGPLQQFSNSIAYAVGVDSFVVIGFFSMCIPPILYFVLTRIVKQRNDDF